MRSRRLGSILGLEISFLVRVGVVLVQCCHVAHVLGRKSVWEVGVYFTLYNSGFEAESHEVLV